MNFSSKCKQAASFVALAPIFACLATTAFAGDAAGTPDTPTTAQLEQGLQQRDALIRELARRVDALQREVSALQGQVDPGGTPVQKNSTSTASRTSTQPQPAPQQSAQQQVQLSTQPNTSSQTQDPPAPATKQTAPSEPGAFVVSKEAAEHALERALVQTGGLILSPGTAEIVPTFSYTRREFKYPGELAQLSNGTFVASEQNITSNQASGGATLRIGLPFASQLQIAAPYDYAGTATTVQVEGAGLSSQTTNTLGYGGTDILFTKQILREGEWRPSLFASIGGHLNQGQPLNATLGTGFSQVNGSLFATKRQDPLVFTAGFSYARSFERGGFQPGDQYTPSLGFLFALSPETSLQFSTLVDVENDTRFDGRPILGSNQVAGIVQFGVLSILAPGLVVNLNAQVGVTPEAPNFGLVLSFPFRFATGL